MIYNFTVIMKTYPEILEDGTVVNRVAKRADFLTKKDADNHVNKFQTQYPDAFVITTPRSNEADWKINKVSKKIELEPKPRFPEPIVIDVNSKIKDIENRLIALEAK